MDPRTHPESSPPAPPSAREGPAGSGRHTLGCDPDAAGHHVQAPRQSAPVAGEPEPEALSRPVWWLAARQRASELAADGEEPGLVARLIAHVEVAWAWIGELEALSRVRGPRMDSDDPRSHFLRFVESDVAVLFRGLAEDAANLVPGRAGSRQEPDPEELQLEAERFIRHLVVLALAASDPVIPEHVRTVVRRVGRDLDDWYPEFAVLAGAAARSRRSDEPGAAGAGTPPSGDQRR